MLNTILKKGQKYRCKVVKLPPDMHLLMCSLSSGPETVRARFPSSPSRFGGSPGLQRGVKQICLENEKANDLHSPHQASLLQWSQCLHDCPVTIEK